MTWITRHANVQAQVKVAAQGKTYISYTLDDTFDLRPQGGRSGAYNTITTVTGILYHDVVGGNDQLKVQAHWSNYIGP